MPGSNFCRETARENCAVSANACLGCRLLRYMLTGGVSSWAETCGAALQLADFGLSRVMETNATHISTNTIGTIAYQPEEVGCLTGAHLRHSAHYTLNISRATFLSRPQC